ncbi:hypothetical protein M407DRAFT_11441 [Tulasnella calospora MUT 4182]|uniref:Uncharacterized protein n=1 Tax=Tulasnella calospora MUT 4182 TaxID=1051891 RepID=A0A0C3Q793_9AGAM|nr:hypothetical protein M407DRAFT_11441 [Tulasnella calospora MUT 4182]
MQEGQSEASLKGERPEERPRRTAYLKNVYASKTPAVPSKSQEGDPPQPNGPKASTSKQPKAARTKVKAQVKASEASGSPQKLTKKEKAAEAAARKAAKLAA